ncbi:MAG TPA: STAS/SEC14 domain-containing protein [Candidatus Methylacidiphilales bacterium]|nr:STAS/SEC14 domain-containing protein [Candidatus Methylacidiphilales bacterium]
MIKLVADGMKENVVALAAHGKVSHEDYERVVIPAVEEKIRMHTKVRLFFHLGEDFAGYTAEALWDDTKIGIRHLTAFEKIAVVTNVEWIKNAVRVCGFFVPGPVKIFPNKELPAAVAWVND